MNHKMNQIKIKTIIGVISKGQTVVGIYFLIFLYNGSIIEAINWGLIFSHVNCNQEKIISAIIIYFISEKNI